MSTATHDRTVIVHIGTPKTGTTALQEALADARPLLLNAGVLYNSTFGDRGTQATLPARIMAQCGNWDNVSEWKVKRFERAMHNRRPFDIDTAFDQELHESTPSTVVVSSEAVWQLTRSRGFLEALYNYLSTRFAVVTIVVYLRRQELYLASQYSQNRKVMPYCSLDLEQARLADEGDLDYWASVSLIADIFGNDAVMVRPYERSSLEGRSTATDFFSRFGLPLPSDDNRSSCSRTLRERSNPSWGRDIVAFVSILNQHLNLFDPIGWRTPLFARVCKVLDELPITTEPVACGRSRAEELLARYGEGNAEIAKRFLGRKDGVLFHEPFEPPDEDRLPEIDSEALGRIASAVIEGLGAEHSQLVEVLRDQTIRFHNHREQTGKIATRLRNLQDEKRVLEDRVRALKREVSCLHSQLRQTQGPVVEPSSDQ